MKLVTLTQLWPPFGGMSGPPPTLPAPWGDGQTVTVEDVTANPWPDGITLRGDS